MLMDSDALGGHIKGTHKMKEKEYKEQYCVYKQKSLTPRVSENRVVDRRKTLKRKPGEQLQEELVRPLKKLKGGILSKDSADKSYGVGVDLERDKSNVSSKGSRRRTEQSFTTESEDLKAVGSDEERMPQKRLEKQIFADAEREKGSEETPRGSRSERRERSKESRGMKNDIPKIVAALSHNMEESGDKFPAPKSVPPPTVQVEESADDEELRNSEEEMSLINQFGGMDKITNPRVGVLKKESRIFSESVLGKRSTQILGKISGTKPPERKPKASSSNEGRTRAGLRKKWKKAEEEFDPFVDVEYDCNLKDCQDCGKVGLSFLQLVHIIFAGVTCDQIVPAGEQAYSGEGEFRQGF